MELKKTGRNSGLFCTMDSWDLGNQFLFLKDMEQIVRNDRLSKLFARMLFIPGVLILLSACGTGQRTAEERVKDYQELRNLVYTEGFEIESQWAHPLSGNMVDLIGNPNYIRFKNDSVNLLLPYFGVRHAGGNYGGLDGGIKYKGVAEELEVREADDESKIEIRFEAEDGTENYDFRITLFSNGNASTFVTSSERNSISYRGSVKKLSKGQISIKARTGKRGS